MYADDHWPAAGNWGKRERGGGRCFDFYSLIKSSPFDVSSSITTILSFVLCISSVNHIFFFCVCLA